MLKLEITKENYWKYLIAIIAFGLVIRLLFPTGLTGSADIGHNYYAYQIYSGSYSPTAETVHYSTRIAYIYPVAFFYRLFGISEFSSYLFSLLLSLSGIVLIYALASFLFGRKVGITSAFLLSFYPLDVINATSMFPDLAHSFFMGLAVLFFFLGRKKAMWKKQAMFLLSGIFIGMAYLMKTSGLLVFFFLMCFGIYELFFIKKGIRFQKRIDWSYILIIAGFGIMYIAGLLHAYAVSGDPFLAEKQLEHAYTISLKNLYNYEGLGLVSRLFFHLPYLMLTNFQFGFFFIFMLIASGYYIFVSRKENTTIMLLWIYGILLYMNFGPTTLNLSNYIPLAAGSPRYLAILTYPALILIASFISEKEGIIKKYLGPFIVIFLLVTSIGFIYINPEKALRDNTKKAAGFLAKENIAKKPVYTDSASYESYMFFSGYAGIGNIKEYIKGNYPYPGSSSIDFSKIKDSYVIIDWAVLSSIPENYEWELPEEIKNPPKNWKLVMETRNAKGNAYIYYVS